MHLLIGLLVVIGLVVWFYKVTAPPPAVAAARPEVAGSAGGPAPGLAYLADGNLFVRGQDGSARQVHSPYVQQVQDRLQRSRERHAWKKDTSFSVSASGALRQFDGQDERLAICSAQFADAGSLLYFMKDSGSGGLFSHDLASGEEVRLLHRQYLDLQDMHLAPGAETLLCSSTMKNGAANIAMLNRDGSQYRELTGGDTIDSSPVRIPGDEHAILFQSAGIARGREGYIAAIGNASIQELNLRSGSITPVLEHPSYDFLQPRVAADGTLYFIRRPFQSPHYGTGNILLDLLLFPFRLLRAVFHYLNFFSLMYSRKPLTGATGPAVKADIRDVVLKGRRIDAEKALRSNGSTQGVPSLVPASWELVRRTRQGEEAVIATHVSSFDIAPSGAIVYTNGRGIFLGGAGAQPRLLMQGDLVGEVLAC